MGRKPYSDRKLVEDSYQLSVSCIKETLVRRIFFSYITWGEDFLVKVFYRLPHDYIIFRYKNFRDEDMELDVPILTQSCNFGGERFYFACPLCDKKVSKLYLPPSENLFACRKCHDLTYRTQKRHLKSQDPNLYHKYSNKAVALYLKKDKRYRKRIRYYLMKAEPYRQRCCDMHDAMISVFRKRLGVN